MSFTPVILETPFMPKGATKQELRRDAARKILYLRACMRDCLLRGEAPFASHGLYTQPGVLRDEVPEEREHGILAGFAWRRAAPRTVVYTDLGTSGGMKAGVDDACRIIEERPGTHRIEYRELGPGWEEQARKTTGIGTDEQELYDVVDKFLAGLRAEMPSFDDGEQHQLIISGGRAGYGPNDEDLLGFRIETRRERML